MVYIYIYIYVHLGALICRLSRIVICTLLNILYFLSASDVMVWSEDMGNIMFRLHVDGFPYRECVGNIINYIFFGQGVVNALNGSLPKFW